MPPLNFLTVCPAWKLITSHEPRIFNALKNIRVQRSAAWQSAAGGFPSIPTPNPSVGALPRSYVITHARPENFREAATTTSDATVITITLPFGSSGMCILFSRWGNATALSGKLFVVLVQGRSVSPWKSHRSLHRSSLLLHCSKGQAPLHCNEEREEQEEEKQKEGEIEKKDLLPAGSIKDDRCQTPMHKYMNPKPLRSFFSFLSLFSIFYW